MEQISHSSFPDASTLSGTHTPKISVATEKANSFNVDRAFVAAGDLSPKEQAEHNVTPSDDAAQFIEVSGEAAKHHREAGTALLQNPKTGELLAGPKTNAEARERLKNKVATIKYSDGTMRHNVGGKVLLSQADYDQFKGVFDQQMKVMREEQQRMQDKDRLPLHEDHHIDRISVDSLGKVNVLKIANSANEQISRDRSFQSAMAKADSKITEKATYLKHRFEEKRTMNFQKAVAIEKKETAKAIENKEVEKSPFLEKISNAASKSSKNTIVPFIAKSSFMNSEQNRISPIVLTQTRHVNQSCGEISIYGKLSSTDKYDYFIILQKFIKTPS